MANSNDLDQRIEEIGRRLEQLEAKVASNHELAEPTTADSEQLQYCGVLGAPPRDFDPDVSVDRRSAILDLGNKWANHTNLHYFMFSQGPLGGADSQHLVVERAFQVWRDVGIGLRFTRVQDPSDAEIRIGFVPRIGSWSTVGTDALNVPVGKQTMNFGWNIDVSGSNGLDTAVHEIGHALGLHHEHQNPNAGIVWDREAVYEYFRRTQVPPWSRSKTDFNILDTLEPTSVGGTNWDPDSIMHYAFVAGLIREPSQYQNGLRPAPGLSDSDKVVVRRFYPPSDAMSVPQLRPWESQRLTLAAGEQRDFLILPSATRDWDIRTFGDSDTVMVLFEELQDGDFRYVNGDDDSGYRRNAAMNVRLVRNNRYHLRIRLYYSGSTGDTAVMMW